MTHQSFQKETYNESADKTCVVHLPYLEWFQFVCYFERHQSPRLTKERLTLDKGTLISKQNFGLLKGFMKEVYYTVNFFFNWPQS